MIESKEKIEQMIHEIKERYDPDRVKETVQEIKSIMILKRMNYIELIAVITELKAMAQKVAEIELAKIKNQTQTMSEKHDVKE